MAAQSSSSDTPIQVQRSNKLSSLFSNARRKSSKGKQPQDQNTHVSPISNGATVAEIAPQSNGDGNGVARVESAQSVEPGQVPTSSSESKPASTEAPASTSAPVADDADKDKDKGSLTASAQTHKARRKGNKSSASEAALSASTDKSATVVSQPKSKPPSSAHSRESFVHKVLRRLIPCVHPAGHTPDLDDAASDPGSSLALREKGAKDADAEAAQPAPVQEAPAPEASTSVDAPAQAPTLEVPPVAPVEDVIPTPSPSKLLPKEETEGLTSGAVQPPGSTDVSQEHLRTSSRDSGDESDRTSSFTEEDDVEESNPMDDVEDDEDRLLLNGGAGIPIGPDGTPRPLLPPLAPQHAGRKCLVLDLDETLVHSSFKSIQQADYVVPVEIEYQWHNVYVIKRPGVDNFLKKMGEIYEVVVFTASLSKYADPVLDKLDIHQVVSHRLFRESCYNHKGNYVKDLSQLGRPIADTIILDNSPASYIFHPNNAVPVSSWFNDPHDTELTDLCPFLADLAPVEDVRGVLDGGI